MIRGPYGISSPDRLSDLEYELIAFKRVPPPQVGGLGKERHFWNIIAILWGKGSPKEFIRHPWAERMVKYACEHDYLGVIGSGSSGKCTAPKTPVLMFDGSVKMACEVKVGEQLMGDDSKPRNVLSTSTGRSNMVRIIPDNGDPWECNDDHILTIKRMWTEDIIDISVKDYLACSRTFKELHELFKLGKNPCRTGFSIQQLGPGDWCGWTLDGNGRFLLGDFTVTHNTDWAAVWAIVNWLCAPEDTLVLVTSTSLKDSRKRIWGSVTAYFQAAGRLPGKLVDSMGTIRTMNEAGEANNDKQGIALLAGEKKKEKEAIGKMIGMKNNRVFLIADELPELSEAILEAAYSNLALNPYFQLIGIGNFNSLYDPLGVFVRPKDGYGSITPDDEEWETERGYCIRFDGLKSPNILDGEDKWPIYTTKKLAAHRASLGENSAAFWRMCRSFPCPEGEENCIYSEADFVRGNAHGSVNWLYEPTPVVAADPAFTNGGDRFAVVYGLYGTSATGVATLQITGIDYLYENMSLTAHGEPRDFQTARMLVDRASAKGIARENLACDCSGPGGLAYGSILTTLWGHRFHPVKFGEAPSNRPVSMDDPKSCKDSFYNKASELWFTGKNFIRNGHIKTLPVEIAKELKSRFYTTVKSGDNLKMKIEPKPDMKARVRMSPDISDAFLMLVDLCRERFDFIAGTGEQRKLTNQSWIDKVKKRNVIYDPELSYADTPR